MFGFRLGRPLGEGAFARVFLGEQADLAGRPVVLKVTDIEGSEPQTLAQLLHAHIVPIYSLHEDRRAGLRAVCMPYLGGASLSAVLARLWADSPRPVAGESFVRALAAVEAPRPDSLREKGKATHLGEPHEDGVAEEPSDRRGPEGGGERVEGDGAVEAGGVPLIRPSGTFSPSGRRGGRPTAPGGRGMAGGESDRRGPEGGGERVEGDGAVEAGGVPLIRPSGTFSPAGRRGGRTTRAGRKRHGGR